MPPSSDDLDSVRDSVADGFLRELAHASEEIPAALDGAVADLWLGEAAARFTVGRCLGRGGFGAVYEAFDRRHRQTVALKMMRRRDARALYLFKREFRELANLTHPSLAALYELHSNGDRWFFTMELVDGKDLVAHVCDGAGDGREARLRDSFARVAEGLRFLHQAGKLHRDLKPSNVIVGSDGRAVILDFGLVADLAAGAPSQVAGTPAFMAPEQAAGEAIGVAADWYAVGVMLHLALTGALPSDGKIDLDAHAPTDLAQLCRRLLDGDPARRPSGSEVIAKLSRGAASSSERALPEAPFVGRAVELAFLRDALAATRAGHPVVALLRGPSGIGKSRLMRRFLDQLPPSETLGLRARCFEQEAVPYKAVDGLVDELCRLLQDLPAGERAAILTDDLALLAQLFPVLTQLPPVAAALHRLDGERTESRVPAFASLRALLRRVAAGRTLVLAIDDLQWGDRDSAALLLELLRPPDAPSLLLVGSFGGDDRQTSEALAELLSALDAERAAGLDLRQLSVAELPPADACALVLAQLDDDSPRRAGAQAIAAEGAGNPFFIGELVRFSVDGAGAPQPLEGMIRARLDRLPDGARRLLEVVALAGQSLARSTAALASGAGDDAQTLSLLRALHWIRVQRVDGEEELLPYHHRLASAVVSSLALPARRDRHRRLADVLEQSNAPPERLAYHFHQGEDPRKAARYGFLAAEQARQALAFDRAARLYQGALDTGMLDGAQAREASVRRAEMLSLGGRPLDAAHGWLALSDGADPATSLRYQQRALHQLLGGGYLEAGQAVLDRLLRALDAPRAPRSQLRAILSVAGLRLRLLLGGLSFVERDERDVPESELLRLDTYGSAAHGLTLINPVAAASLRLRHLLSCLAVGEPRRIARALALETIALTVSGSRLRPRFYARAAELATRLGDPHATGMVALAAAMKTLVDGDWRGGAEQLRRSQAMLAGTSLSVVELDFAQIQIGVALWFQGDLAALAQMVAERIADSRERGNRYAESMTRLTTGFLLDLAADQPERARETVRAALAPWAESDFLVQHFRALAAEVRIALYCGHTDEAEALIARYAQRVRRSRLLVAGPLRIEWTYWNAAVALGRGSFRRALRLARRLAREKIVWAAHVAGALHAAIARRRGHSDEACARLSSVESGFRAAGMPLAAEAARRQRGLWMGGSDGRALVDEADRWLAARGIRDPARLAAMIIPGD